MSSTQKKNENEYNAVDPPMSSTQKGEGMSIMLWILPCLVHKKERE